MYKKNHLKIIRIIILFFSIVLSIFLFTKLEKVLLTFIISIIIAYLLNPIIVYLEKNKLSRKKSLILLSVLIFLLIIVSLLFFIPLLVEQLKYFLELLPEYIVEIESNINYWNKYISNYFSNQFILNLTTKLITYIEELISNKINKILENILNSINIIFSLLLAPVISYYILRDLKFIKKKSIFILPNNKKSIFMNFFKEINHILSGYLRGQAVLSLIITILISFALYILKIKFYFVFAILAGITNMIPFVGPILGAFFPTLFAFLSSPLKGIACIILFLLVQEIENTFLQPKILSRNIGLHPITIILSLLAGAELFAFWGVVLAVPLAAIIKSLFLLIIELLFPLDKIST